MEPLPENSGEAAANKPELAMQNERTATTYSISPQGVGSRRPHLKEIDSGFIKKSEDYRYQMVETGE